MEDNFNKHLGNKLKLRRLALGLTQTKVAKAINVTFQQIQKYEKGTNGVSSIRLLQLSNYLKVPIDYFFEDFSEYLINIEKSKEGHMNINYNFLIKLYSELNSDQKLKLRRLALGLTQTKVAKAINVTFQQIQKYEKGTNGVSSIRLLQLSNYLKVPINYFFEDFSEYLINVEKSKESPITVNYNFLVKLYSELTNDQKIKFNKNLQTISVPVTKTG